MESLGNLENIEISRESGLFYLDCLVNSAFLDFKNVQVPTTFSGIDLRKT